MRFSAGAPALLLTAGWLLMAQSPGPPKTHPGAEKLTFDVEWRLIHAGVVTIETQKSQAAMKIQSAGLVSSLFKIEDNYAVNFDEGYCATSSLMDSQEGKRHHETKVAYDRRANRATFLERDVLTDMTIRSNQLDVPNCVHEAVTAILQFRRQSLEPGQSTQIAMSDGRKSALVKLEAQAREELQTPAGKFKTIRYEANMMNGIIYARKGRVLIWMSDDERRLPVQIRIRLQFPIGNVTLMLEKEERT